MVLGAPLIIVRDGRMLTDAMATERLSTDDLYEAARGQGVRRIADVDLAVLEPDGGISFFTSQRSEDDEIEARERPPASK